MNVSNQEQSSNAARSVSERAPLIVVEGIDGAGKSTVVQNIQRALNAAGYDAKTSFEPSDCTVGQELRRRFDNGIDTEPLSDFFLFMADRVEHNEQVVKPFLDEGHPVILDRYMDSTRAYQPVAMADVVDDPNALIKACHEQYALDPDLVLYLDISVGAALERLNDFKGEENRDNYEQREFLEDVQENYINAVAGRPNVKGINAEQSPENVLVDCLSAMKELFDHEMYPEAYLKDIEVEVE